MKLFIAGVMFLASGASSFAAQVSSETFYENSSGIPLVSLLTSAQKSVDIEIYEMDDPAVMNAIKGAVDRGVKMRIVKEDKPVGGSCRVFTAITSKDNQSCKDQKNLVTYVQKGGGQYVPFITANLCAVAKSTCYEHGKMVIVDGTQTLVSTGNFNTSNLCDKIEHPSACNRDYSILSTDEDVISTLSQFFENDLKGSAYNVSDVLSQAPTQKLTVSPLSLAPLVAFINSAKTKVQVQNQYLKDTNLNQALMDAAKRGVTVEVMVASACSFGKPTASELKSWNKIYTAFDGAGVKARAFTRNIQVNGIAGYLHAKAIIVDETRAWVGSVNGSTTSLSNNREYGLFVNDLTEVQKLKAFMDQDFVNPNGESWQDSAICKNDPASSQAPTELHFH